MIFFFFFFSPQVRFLTSLFFFFFFFVRFLTPKSHRGKHCFFFFVVLFLGEQLSLKTGDFMLSFSKQRKITRRGLASSCKLFIFFFFFGQGGFFFGKVHYNERALYFNSTFFLFTPKLITLGGFDNPRSVGNACVPEAFCTLNFTLFFGSC